MSTILVIDDDRAILLLIKQALSGLADIVTAETAGEGMRVLRDTAIDVVLLDIVLPDRSGMAVFCEIHELDRRLPVIFMTIEATSETAIQAMQMGAFDYLAKPLNVSSLRVLVSRALEQRELSSVPVAIVADETLPDDAGELFIGRSPPMLEVFKGIGRVSKQHVPVLIRGESGTGKELVARAIYQHGNRADGLFLAVNCAALPENLLESELFGHEKGAFTGADTRRIGKFEQCNGGTLFLDEIGDMSPSVQAKVLRVLQDQRFERIGGNNELKTDVRIVAASNRPLEKMVADGDFREDLLYRLNAFTITLPPLRDRTVDIPLLIHHFLGQAKREFSKSDLEGASPEAVELLKSHPWPGNIRQLRAVIRRCVLESVLPVIVPEALPVEVRNGISTLCLLSKCVDNEIDVATSHNSGVDMSGRELPELVARLLEQKSADVYAQTIAYAEQYLLVQVLRQTDGNQTKAATMLGITRGKVRDRIATHDIRLESGITIGE